MSSVGGTSAELRRATADGASRGDPSSLGRDYIEQDAVLRLRLNVGLVDKTLENDIYWRLILAALPATVLAQRSAMDACWPMYKADGQVYLLLSPDRTGRVLSRLSPSVVALEGSFDGACAATDQLSRDQGVASRKMIVFVGLPWDDEVLRFHQSPVSKGRHHPQGLAPLRATIELPEAELA